MKKLLRKFECAMTWHIKKYDEQTKKFVCEDCSTTIERY